MKQQDNYLYDPTNVENYDIFHRVGSNSFYINSSCILVTDKTITKGKEYVIFDNTTDTGITISDVILVTSYYLEGIISMIVRDIRSKRVFSIHQRLESSENDCIWVLVDINYFVDKMDAKAIQSYCGNCNDPKKKPNTEFNHKSSQDDLLEFEF
jgi:hypothetical protein